MELNSVTSGPQPVLSWLDVQQTAQLTGNLLYLSLLVGHYWYQWPLP